MSLSAYKIFTHEKLKYLDLNNSFATIIDYINNYLVLLADCVSANLANKIVKRDGVGSFSANAVTANNFIGNLIGDVTGDVIGNLTGNVTGNITGDLTGNVQGNLRGDVIGNVTGDVTGDVNGNADTATELIGVTGGKWVQVVNSSVSIINGDGQYIHLLQSRQHHFYLCSVYSSMESVAQGYSTQNSYWQIKQNPGGILSDDFLYIRNNYLQTMTFYYKVYVWE